MADTTKFARREFLNTLATTITGTATLAVTSSLVQAAPLEVPDVKEEHPPKSMGYQRSQHIDTYYHLADF